MSNLASPVLTPDSVSSLKVVDLRQELDRRGLDKSGLKAELVKRLEKSLLDESVNTDADESLNGNEEDKENIEDQSDEKNNKNERKVTENKDNLSTETNDSTEIFSTEEREETNEVTGEAESNKSEAPAEEKPTAMEEFEVKNDNGEPAQKEDITDKDNESPETSAPHDVQEDASETASAIIDLTDEVNMANEDTEEDAPMESTEPVKETSVPMEEDNAPKTEESASQEESVNGEQDEKENEQNNNKDADKEETTADKSIDVDSTNATQQSESTEQSNENKTDSPNKANEKPSGSSVSSTPIDAKPVEKKTDLSRCIWISNLSSLTKAIDLKDLCVKFGKVLGAKVVTSAKTPGAQCFGFVTLSMSDEAEKCIESLHKTTLHDKVIQVEKAKTDPTPAKKPTESTKEAEKKSEDRHRSSNRHYRSSGRHSSRSEHRHGNSRRYGADSDRSSRKQSREEDKSKEDKPKESKPKEVITISDDKSNDAETAPSKPEVPAKTPEQLKKEREEKIEKEHKLREERRKKERELERQMREERRKDQEIREKERRERARKEAERVRLEREKQRELEKQREKERERKRERFLRERKEREELDRVRREKEREALERERLELERLERERKERERLETERLQLERERQERERKAKQEREDRIERERLHLEEERLERERRERERESRTIDRGMEHRGGSSNLKRANELQQYDPKRLRREGELPSKSHFNGDQRNFVKDGVYDDVYQRRGNAAREDERFRKTDPRVDRSCPAAPERRDPRLYGRDRSPLKVDRGYARDDRREWANEKNTNAPKTLSDVLGRAGLTGILGSQNDGRNDDRYRSDNRRDEPPRGVPDRNVRREEDMRRDGGMRREGDMRREGGDMRRDSGMRREPDVRRDVDMRRDDRGIDRFADQRRDDRKRPEVNSAPPVNIPDRRGLHPLAAEIGIRGLPHHPPPQPQQRMMQPITDMFGRPLRPVANATPAAQAIQAGYVAAAQGLALHQAARNNNMPFPNQVRHQSQSILPNIRRF